MKQLLSRVNQANPSSYQRPGVARPLNTFARVRISLGRTDGRNESSESFPPQPVERVNFVFIYFQELFGAPDRTGKNNPSTVRARDREERTETKTKKRNRS